MTSEKKIESDDLYNNKYDRDTLKKHIYALNLFDILKTQLIDEDFAAKYILNPNYQMTPEEAMIDVKMVLELQPHMKMETLLAKLMEYDSDKDSLEDFETVATREK